MFLMIPLLYFLSHCYRSSVHFWLYGFWLYVSLRLRDRNHPAVERERKKEGGEKNYSRQGFIHELQGLRDISLKPELGPPGAARQLPKLHFPLLLDIHALCIPANGLDSCA